MRAPTTHKLSIALLTLCLFAAPFAFAACGDDDDAAKGDSAGGTGGGKDAGSKPIKPGSKDAGVHDAGSTLADAGEPDCYEHPKTHLQIINACTDAKAIDTDPDLPLLLADGGLPDLP